MDETRKVITAEPENSETPLGEISSWVTPRRLFFVRNHFELPSIDLDTWRLRLYGCVGNSQEWCWQDLADLPQRTVFATIECAGNGRSFLREKVEGVQWGAGAIGQAEWTGVSVKTLLKAAGIRDDAVEVVFEGADEGVEADHPETMRFARSLPLDKALHPDALIALCLNGEVLDTNHGYPARLFVPGWYGVTSVKWLQCMQVIDRPFDGYFQTKKYTYEHLTADGPKRTVVGPMVIKLEIVRPQVGDVLGSGTNRISGVAWTGEQPIEAVDVSTDGGQTWHEANLFGLRAEYSWCMWEYLWEVNEPGQYALQSRARSVTGQVQPATHDQRRGGYMINFVRSRHIKIEPDRKSEAQPGDIAALLYDMDLFAEENIRLPLDVDLAYMDGAGI